MSEISGTTCSTFATKLHATVTSPHEEKVTWTHLSVAFIFFFEFFLVIMEITYLLQKDQRLLRSNIKKSFTHYRNETYNHEALARESLWNPGLAHIGYWKDSGLSRVSFVFPYLSSLSTLFFLAWNNRQQLNKEIRRVEVWWTHVTKTTRTINERRWLLGDLLLLLMMMTDNRWRH